MRPRRRTRRRVLAEGGLFIVGTERHESRRVDNQLRGRSGRQGDPGASRFYLSLEDDLMRIFGSDRLQNIMRKLGMEEGVPIEHGMVSRAIERAQKQVEGRNFETRKHLLEYDDVMNRQREEIYTLRREILQGRQGKEDVLRLAEVIFDASLNRHLDPEKSADEWDLTGFGIDLKEYFGLDAPDLAGKDRDAIREQLLELVPPVRGEGDAARPRDDAAPREVRDAPGRRPAVEGPPPRDRPPEGGNRAARVRPARPARRVQEGVLRALHRHEGAHRGPDRPVPLPAPARRSAKRSGEVAGGAAASPFALPPRRAPAT